MVANALVRDDDEGDKEGQWQEQENSTLIGVQN